MPEGPEIRRAADRLRRAIGDRVIERVQFGLDRLLPFQGELEGQRIAAIEPRGKALLTRFEQGLVLYSHNQLYGRWQVSRDGRLPQTSRQLRVGLFSSGPALLLYSASDVEVLTVEEVASHPFLARLGPDALDLAIDARAIASRLAGPRCSGRRLAALLLDQSVVAGLGNYLRSGILFVSGLAANLRPRDLQEPALLRLAEAILAVTRQSYRSGGITNDLARAEALKRAGVRRGARRFHVFSRAGQACWHCGSSIERIEAAGRRLYYCPRCQPAGLTKATG